MRGTKPSRARQSAAISAMLEHLPLANDGAEQDTIYVVPQLTLHFSADDVAEMARLARVPIKHPEYLGSAGLALKGVAEAFAEQARVQRGNPPRNRGKGRPRDAARKTLLRGWANTYWRLSGKRPNFRNKVGARDGESNALLFLRAVLTRTVEQLERAMDGVSRNSAREFSRLLALKKRGLVGRFEEDMASDADIVRLLYPRALEGFDRRGRPYSGRP